MDTNLTESYYPIQEGNIYADINDFLASMWHNDAVRHWIRVASYAAVLISTAKTVAVRDSEGKQMAGKRNAQTKRSDVR